MQILQTLSMKDIFSLHIHIHRDLNELIFPNKTQLE